MLNLKIIRSRTLKTIKIRLYKIKLRSKTKLRYGAI